ncbi:MAG: zf-HC2 domain-containing protein [Ignavibacteria bacterium]|nr:zf-HC2 domain-containing protein [Ignavibacteria bacterium]
MKHLSIQQIFEYIDGEIPAGERALLQKHIDTCTGCQSELVAHQALTSEASKAPLEAVDENQVMNIMNLVMNERLQSRLVVSMPSRVALPKVVSATSLKHRKIGGIPIRRIIGFTIFATCLAIMVNIPRTSAPRQENTTLHSIVGTYYEWMQVFVNSVVELVAPLASIIPVKSTTTLGLFLIAGILLWLLDRVFQKRFHIRV